MADGSDLRPDALPDLDDLLQCPVCYEVPTGHIYQCNEGHHVCGRCKARLGACPVCRSMFFGTRNYVMEELITKIRNLNAFKLAGKLTVASSSDGTTSADTSIGGGASEPNQRDASFSDDTRASTSNGPPAACKGLFRCLCCKLGQTERLPAARLLNHLRYFHSHKLIEGKSEEGEYAQVWQLQSLIGRQATAVRVADMGIFFLVVELDESTFHAWLVMAASAFVANEFCYTLTVTAGDREIVFNDCVSSVRSCEGTLKKRSRCLEARGGDAQAVHSVPQFTARLTLRRTPTDQPTLNMQPRTVVRLACRPVAPAPQPQRLSRNARRRQRLLQNPLIEPQVAPVAAPPRPPAQEVAPPRPRRRRR